MARSQAGQPDQRVVVGDGVDVTVVRHPVQRDGVVRGPGQAGEAQAQVVDRLEEDRGGGVDLGPLLAQEVDVADRVLARQARDAAGAAHPLGQLGGGVALDVERTAHGLADGAGAPGVHPGDGRTDGGPVVVDRHGARPLRRAAHADDVPGATPASASARRAEPTMASHQACGDCSAPPSSVRSIPTAWKAWATTRPVDAKTATFGPPVPRSTARTCGSVDSMGRSAVAVLARQTRGGGGHGEEAYRAKPARSRAGLRCS